MEAKTRYTMVNRRGEEIYHSDSYLGFIGSAVLISIMSVVVLTIIAAVICGIGSLFS